MRLYTLLFSGLMMMGTAFSQSHENVSITESNQDSVIVFTTKSASEYIGKLLKNKDLWRSGRDTVKLSLARLIEHFHEPFDSVDNRLSSFPYNSVEILEKDIVRYDTIPFRWLNDSTLITDSPELTKDPFIVQKTIVQKYVDSLLVLSSDSTEEVNYTRDTLAFLYDTIFQEKVAEGREEDTLEKLRKTVLVKQDTLTEILIDSSFLESENIPLYRYSEGRLIPSYPLNSARSSARFYPEAGRIIISDTITKMVADAASPFHIVPGDNMPDSLMKAVETLLAFTWERDSVLLYFNDIRGRRTPFWLTSGDDELYRYWVKNHKNDSITLWMGNPSKYDISLVLEQDVNLNRMQKLDVDNIPITKVQPEFDLAELEPLEEIPVYWDYNFSTSFSLNQTYLSNWSKGGENSFSSLLDIQGGAIYTDTKAKTKWTSSGRLKFGNIITEEYGLRTNTDMLEFNSQYNKEIKEKIDFSAVFYMKNQLAKGYNFPNDSVVVSKFLNPGTFTVGLGVEYKPFNKTSLNFSLLSYKNTFVLDTANIDQTLHGIDAGKRARQEMGGQLVIKNSLSILEDLNISNKIRLFSGYLNNPENIDVDWEIDIEKKISWYFTILLNLHMIYDDDIRFPVLDDNDEPVILPDGSEYKVPKLQFKQFLGLTFLFKF